VKFHWKPVNGMHSLVWDEAQKIAGKDPDFNRRDLWESIEMGNFPEFELGVQIVEEEDEFKFDFDLLDPTKLIPEELVPVQIIGKMVLNRNPDNFFAETEQVAFHPGNVVPGIDFSNDPLLQGRLFSYLDTQLIRLGGPNFHEIPINRPVAEVHNNQRDGYMRQTINRGRSNYFPNTMRGGDPRPASEQERGYAHYAERVDGTKIRVRSESFKDHFSQARLFWNSQTAVEKQHLMEAFFFELGKVESMDVRKRMVDLIVNVDAQLAEKVANQIGVPAPSMQSVPVTGKEKQQGKLSVDRSEALSMMHTRSESVKGRKVAVLVAEGADTGSLGQVKQALEQAGAQVKLVGKQQGMLNGTQGGAELKIDESFLTSGSIMYDAVLIPAGEQAAAALSKQGDAIHFVNEAFKHCKPIAALENGVDVLAEADVIDVFFADGGEHKMRVDKGVVTSRGSTSLESFAHEFMQAIAQHRHWERESVKGQIPA
jgi:catalase